MALERLDLHSEGQSIPPAPIDRTACSGRGCSAAKLLPVSVANMSQHD